MSAFHPLRTLAATRSSNPEVPADLGDGQCDPLFAEAAT